MIPGGGGVQDCPLKRMGCIEILVTGADWQPVADVAVVLAQAERQTSSLTDSEGNVRFEGLETQPYRIVLPDFDKTAARLQGSSPLPPTRLKGAEPPAWQGKEMPPPAPASHTAAAGETFRQAVVRFGFVPESVWKLDSNRALRKGRSLPWCKEGESIAVGHQKFVRGLVP